MDQSIRSTAHTGHSTLSNLSPAGKPSKRSERVVRVFLIIQIGWVLCCRKNGVHPMTRRFSLGLAVVLGALPWVHGPGGNAIFHFLNLPLCPPLHRHGHDRNPPPNAEYNDAIFETALLFQSHLSKRIRSK